MTGLAKLRKRLKKMYRKLMCDRGFSFHFAMKFCLNSEHNKNVNNILTTKNVLGQISLAHIWLWLTVLTHHTRHILATRVKVLHFLWVFEAHLALKTLAISHHNWLMKSGPHLAHTAHGKNPNLAQFMNFGTCLALLALASVVAEPEAQKVTQIGPKYVR